MLWVHRNTHSRERISVKRLSWLSVEDYGTTPLEIMVVSTMKGYLRQMPEDEALRKIGEIIEPKVIRLAGEDSAPMPVQSIIEGAKLAAFIDEAVADSRLGFPFPSSMLLICLFPTPLRKASSSCEKLCLFLKSLMRCPSAI